MKIIIKYLFAFLIMASLPGCSNTSPKAYFDEAALNSNLVTTFYKPKFFENIDKNYLRTYIEKTGDTITATSHLKDILPDLGKNISRIKSLKKTAETKEMLEASVAYFEQADKIFKNDYYEISGMIDADRPQAEIDAAIKKIFETNDGQMSEKYNRLWKAAEVYAKENEIPMAEK